MVRQRSATGEAGNNEAGNRVAGNRVAGGVLATAGSGRAELGVTGADASMAGRGGTPHGERAAPAEGEPGLVSTWRALAARHATVTSALERDLAERHGLGVSEFEVLERLAEDGEHKFRVQELAESVHLSQSALSRLIGKLEGHGLVQRSLCDLDRRGIYVCLTEAGKRRHAEAQPTQRAVLAATLGGGPGPSAS
jgi:DNA-binding MarR family transcriptional regulator